jgi:RHH-type proline utilization regulon transcriptional repressor/proline dehydrogenase/delta 1-pyrroline-5-carboxylate dehydrogenase
VAPCAALRKAPSVTPAERLESCIAALEIDPRSEHPPLVAKAIALARVLQRRAVDLQSPEERRQQAEFERIMRSHKDKATLMQLPTRRSARVRLARGRQLTHILDILGIRASSRCRTRHAEGFRPPASLPA